RERRELPPVAAGMRRTPLMGRVFTSLPCTYSSFRALEMCRPLHLPSAVSRSARTRKALRQAKRIIRIKEEHDVLAEMAVIPTTIRCLSRAQPSHTDQPGAGTRSRRVSPRCGWAIPSPYDRGEQSIEMIPEFFPGSQADRGSLEVGDFNFFVRRGYAFVIANLRGTGDSGSEFGNLDPDPVSVRDIAEAIEWLAVQPWCNGKVAMNGVSYFSVVQKRA